MFTRYSGIEVPQNYSGNRFRKKSIEDTETKVHTNQAYSAVKSSVSPSFEYKYENERLSSDENDASIENEITTDNYVSEEFSDNSSENSNENFNEAINDEEAKETNSKEINSNSSFLDNLNLSFMTDFFKNIQGEDLLLIALIIFLASDKNVSNNDIIILLALLLVYHA